MFVKGFFTRRSVVRRFFEIFALFGVAAAVAFLFSVQNTKGAVVETVSTHVVGAVVVQVDGTTVGVTDAGVVRVDDATVVTVQSVVRGAVHEVVST